MKRLLSLTLCLLMILPLFSTYALGDSGVNITSGAKNIANQANITIEGETILGFVRPEVLVDGDKSTGTKSPNSRIFSYIFSYDSVCYFTDFVIACNGMGTLASGTGLTDGGSVTQDTYNVREVTLSFYNDGKLVYTETEDVSQKKEWTLKQSVLADQVYVTVGNKELDRSVNYYMWEVELYAIEDMELCDVQLHNIASDAEFSFDSYREDDPDTEENEKTDPWWAVDWAALVDGNREFGTHSPKGGQYSFFMSFPKEYLFSEITFYCNGKGTLSAYNTPVPEYVYNNSMVQILLYDINDTLVYDSKDVSVSGLEAKIDPYVKASKIEFRMFNGKHSGNEYMWEIETMVETGSHIFEQTDFANPTCDEAGFKQFSCHCGKVIRQVVPATGFHEWDEGVVLEGNEATTEANGILTKTCELCGTTGDFDIPALGHNWDAGTVKKPTCTEEGYTEYKCSDPGCTLSYTSDSVSATGHEWNDGEVITPAKVGVDGKSKLTCRVCGDTKEMKIPALKYSTSTTSFDVKNSSDDINVVYNTSDEQYKPDATGGEKLLETEEARNMFDNDISTYWYAPTGSTVEILLDRTYYLTKGEFLATSNWARYSVFFYADGENTATFSTGGFQELNLNNPKKMDMSKSLKGGTKVDKIVIKVEEAKWANGNAAKVHDINLVVHACEVIEANYYIPDTADARYTPATCTTDGQTVSICPVCELETLVTLPHDEWGHTAGALTPVTEPTCSTPGVATSTCVNCPFVFDDIPIEPTYIHEYTEEITFMEALCGFMGIKQHICPGCGKVGSQEPIPSTGVHNYGWVEKYPSTFTSEGMNSWECSGCACIDPAVGEPKYESIEKKTIEKELITFVGASIRYTDYVGLRLTYKLNLEYFDVLGYECDIRVITEVTNAEGVTKTVESYGKYSLNKYDATTGEVSVVLNPYSVYDEYTINTKVRLMNFLGIEYVDCEMDLTGIDGNENGAISVCEVAEYLLDQGGNINSSVKTLYEAIVDGKN